VKSLAAVQQAHRALMDQYIRIISETTKMPFFVPPELPGGGASARGFDRLTNQAFRQVFRIFVLRFLVIGYVDSHIKRKLNELSAAYVQLRQASKPESDQVGFNQWLKETEEECKALSGSLPSWQRVRSILNVFFPVVIGLAVADAAKDDLYQVVVDLDRESLETVGLALVFPVVYFASFMHAAFSKKRSLWLIEEEPRKVGQRLFLRSKTYKTNVYAVEDQLFEALDRGKRKEFPTDSLAYFIGSGIFGGGSVYAVANWGSSSRVLDYVPGAVFLVFALIMGLGGLFREWK
jgi:hypothetical protein